MKKSNSLSITAMAAALTVASLSASEPNVLLIFPDQLQTDVLSCYGGPVSTPNIDRLAEEGVRFTDATCPTPFCAPTRMSLVTGVYPQQHGVVQNTGWRQPGMNLDDQTYPRVLFNDGYSTHHYGKWHLETKKKGDTMPWYSDQFRYFPEFYDSMADQFDAYKERGDGRFCDWYGLIFPIQISDDLRAALDHNDLWNEWEDHWAGKMVLGMGRLDLEHEDCYDFQVADKAIETIKKKSAENQPFMINIGFNIPHDPYLVPSPYYEQFPLDEIELPDNVNALHDRFTKDWGRQVNVKTRGPYGEETGLLEFMRIYYGNVKFLDDQIGRVLHALEESGELENTIIVFLSDHGDMVGGHGMTWKETEAFYEEVATIPLIVRYPKKLKPHVNTTPVNTVDVFPTIFDLLGREQLPGIAGKSLVPYMTGEKKPEDAFPYTFSVRISYNPHAEREILPEMAGHFMVRGKGFKYMVYGQCNDPRYSDEPNDILYDLSNDPGETLDLANDSGYEGIKKEMNQVLQDWLEQTGWKGRPALRYSLNQ
ncbi:MAG: sulfatase [Puniceicoccaceae bacterium]